MFCSPAHSPSQQCSSSGDLLPEMMESETPPPTSPPHKADDPEVSSQWISPDPQRPEGNLSAAGGPGCFAPRETVRKSPGLSDMQPDTLTGLLRQAPISEAHRTLMGTMVERISSAKSGLNEAFTSLLRGFEVHKVIYVFLMVPHMLGVLCIDSSPRDSSCRPEAANRGS